MCFCGWWVLGLAASVFFVFAVCEWGAYDKGIGWLLFGLDLFARMIRLLGLGCAERFDLGFVTGMLVKCVLDKCHCLLL